MPKVIIADTSCLILLDKIDGLCLLQNLFGQILLTEEIAYEFGQELPDWCLVQSVSDKKTQTILEASIDKGEASALALALEHEQVLLIMDDLKGRRYAEQLGIKLTGSLGILLAAKNAGFLLAVKPMLDKIRQTNFRISPELEKHTLLLANES